MGLLTFNKLSLDQYMSCIASTGWQGILHKGETALQGVLQQSWYTVSVTDGNGKLLGCGRIISDGHIQALLCDIIVLPEHQGRGVGTAIVNQLVEQCKQQQITMILLFAAKGKGSFYLKNGFKSREGDAPGMYYASNIEA